ncbi:ADP-ribose pyrophosphatase YjhB, NUDIX family [Nitrosospira sp. Nl5]|uniref:NUDIX hydrolase n=1 Tax=Nitrosospira sp. Nl5 TaxID=200120 RepID=UPI0008870F7F|nr:NUDIX hydrolase [Nitrosospira sp. Nl5]SCY20979.1 ADP-ribose pyrophosphatase YjhB, NUDIX family [Nitrosospira sp. Nl5]
MSSSAMKVDKLEKKNEELAPVRLHSRHLACENTIFSVFLDHVTGTQGHEVLLYLSVLPKGGAEGMVAGVGVLPIKDGKLGLIRVFRHPLSRWSWEVPRGLVNAGETAEQAAVRELREETGFAAKPTQFVALGVMAPEAGVIAGCIQLFSVILEKDESVGAVDGELGHGELAFFRRDEITAMIESGSVQDGCTMSAILKHTIKERWFETQ